MVQALKSSHARYAAHTAAVCGYAFRALDGGDGYLFEIADGARSAILACGPATPYVLNSAAAYSLARDKGFANDALMRRRLPVIPSQLFFTNDRHAAHRSPGREPADARAFARAIAYPLFCKPVSGARGDFAERIASPAAFDDYLARVASRHDAILAQPFLKGEEYRVFVLEDRALFAYAKSGPRLTGDGAADIATLYARHLEALGPTALAHPPAEAAHFSDVSGAALAVTHVPDAGADVRIEGRANRSSGGGAHGFTDAPAPPLEALACAAAEALSLKLAGIDIFDLSPARDLSDLVVIEANANPAIETLEAENRFDLIETIWRANFAAALR